MSVRWTGTANIIINTGLWGERMTQALIQFGQYWAGVFEAYAKENAPWTDQTGNARQALYAWIEEGETVITLWLSHGVEYGKYLETRFAGRYAIIWPTIERHLPAMNQMLREVFGR